MHRIFISYHHENDQAHKEALLKFNDGKEIFEDGSVDTGDIDDTLTDEAIREKIRDDYLRETSVTVILVGTETKNRKHIDWEIYSSMFDGKKNKKSGVIVVNLPSTNCTHALVTSEDEKKLIYPEVANWEIIKDRTEFERRYPYLPPRIIDNLVKGTGRISILSWQKFTSSKENMSFLIEKAFNDREGAEYDLSTPMRRANS